MSRELITQPWNDTRIKIGTTFIGCGSKENADLIMSLQAEVIALREQVAKLTNKEQNWTNFSHH